MDVPPEMVDGVGGGEDDGAVGGECEADEVVARDRERGLALRGNADDPTLAIERRGDV